MLQGFASPTLSFFLQSKQDIWVNASSQFLMTPNKISVMSRWRGRFFTFWQKSFFAFYRSVINSDASRGQKRETSVSAKDRIKSLGRDKSVKKHYTEALLEINLQANKVKIQNEFHIINQWEVCNVFSDYQTWSHNQSFQPSLWPAILQLDCINTQTMTWLWLRLRQTTFRLQQK